MTPRQREVYQFIKAFIEEHGYAPYHYQIEEALGIARGSVYKQIQFLAAQGHINVKPYAPAGITLPDEED